MKKPVFLDVQLVLLLFLGLNGLAGGGSLMLSPDGSLLGMQKDWLGHSPFSNYFIPGTILFLFNGLLPLFIFIGLLIKPQWPWANAFNIYLTMHWAWTYSLYSGIIAITWITIQLIMTQYFWIQPVIIFTGLLIIICALVPSVMNYYQLDK